MKMDFSSQGREMLLFLTTNNSRRDVMCKPAKGQLHDGVILLQLPELESFFLLFSYSN